MTRSFLRMLKHISLALLAIVAVVCITEVGLRGHELYLRCQGDAADRPIRPLPCPVAYQQLPPLTAFTHHVSGTGEAVVIETNQLGLRGPQIVMPKPDGVFRIVCLGDEATLAPDVPLESTFVTLVQQTLRQQSEKPVEVVNAGLPGYCPLLSLAWARQRLTGLQPDLVILCCDYSDMGDDRHVRPLTSYAADGTLESVCHPAAAQRSQQLMQAIEQEFVLAKLIRRQAGEMLEGTNDDDDQAWSAPNLSEARADPIQIRQTWEPIAALRDICKQLNSDFVVAIVPSKATQSASVKENDDVVRLLGEASEEFGVPYLDVTADFSPQPDPPLFLRGNGALSVEGHRLFAELLSWAVIHREQGVEPATNSPSDGPAMKEAAPAAVSPPPTVEPTSAAAPLPTPGRRPRASDAALWNR